MNLIIDKSVTRETIREISASMNLDLIAAFKVMKDEMLSRLEKSVREGVNPEQAIKDILSLFDPIDTTIQKKTDYKIGDKKTRPDGTEWIKTGVYSWAKVKDEEPATEELFDIKDSKHKPEADMYGNNVLDVYGYLYKKDQDAAGRFRGMARTAWGNIRSQEEKDRLMDFMEQAVSYYVYGKGEKPDAFDWEMLQEETEGLPPLTSSTKDEFMHAYREWKDVVEIESSNALYSLIMSGNLDDQIQKIGEDIGMNLADEDIMIQVGALLTYGKVKMPESVEKISSYAKSQVKAAGEITKKLGITRVMMMTAMESDWGTMKDFESQLRIIWADKTGESLETDLISENALLELGYVLGVYDLDVDVGSRPEPKGSGPDSKRAWWSDSFDRKFGDISHAVNTIKSRENIIDEVGGLSPTAYDALMRVYGYIYPEMNVDDATVQDMTEALCDALEAEMDGAPRYVNFHLRAEVLKGLLRQERTINLFEGGEGSGSISTQYRKLWEKKLSYGNSDDLEKSERPTYGWVGTMHAQDKDVADMYGNTRFKLKSEVHSRITYTFGNSSEDDNLPFQNDVYGALDTDGYVKAGITTDDNEKSTNRNWALSSMVNAWHGYTYIESQVWGGVSLYDDVEAIETDLDEDRLRNTEEGVLLMQVADKYGILLINKNGGPVVYTPKERI